MKKGFVRYNWKNYYGGIAGGNIEWFDTIEEAQARAKKLKDGNGEYIEIVKVNEADYDEYLNRENKIKALRAKIEELEKEAEEEYERG